MRHFASILADGLMVGPKYVKPATFLTEPAGVHAEVEIAPATGCAKFVSTTRSRPDIPKPKALSPY